MAVMDQSQSYTGMLCLFDPPFNAEVAPVDLALRTISPIGPEYYGTRPPWDLYYQSYPQWWVSRPGNSTVHSSQQHAGPHVCHISSISTRGLQRVVGTFACHATVPLCLFRLRPILDFCQGTSSKGGTTRRRSLSTNRRSRRPCSLGRPEPSQPGSTPGLYHPQSDLNDRWFRIGVGSGLGSSASCRSLELRRITYQYMSISWRP